MSSTSPSRSDELDRLAAGEFDLCVIGGGVTGAGLARDAQLRGLRVALVEKHDFGSGTSSKSSKLIHGGVRYMEHLEFGLVHESVRERALLLRDVPHLVRPVPFMYPAYKGQKPSLFALDVGLWLYDAFARFRVPKIHKAYRKGRVRELEPLLTQERLNGALVYYDAMTDDARLVLENVVDARAAGALCLSYVAAEGLLRDGGRVNGVKARCVESGRVVEVRAKAVFAATGPWTDQLLGDLGDGLPRKLLRPTKGVHIVVDRARLPVNHAVVMRAHKDKRTIFTIPWEYRTVIGTTDTDDSAKPEDVRATADDVRYLLDIANAHFPGIKLVPEDVISTWAGLRPLVAPDAGEGKKTASQVSREHELLTLPSGVILMVGGKLTTYRHMAEQAADRVMEFLGRAHGDVLTRQRPLPGAVGLVEGGDSAVKALAAELVREHKVPEASARHLSRTYGVRARKLVAAAEGDDARRVIVEGLPHVWAEVDFAVREDLAFRLDDVLARRTLFLLVDKDQGLGVMDAVAARMQKLCGWDAARTERELEHYQKMVEASRAWHGEERGLPRRIAAAHLRKKKA